MKRVALVLILASFLGAGQPDVDKGLNMLDNPGCVIMLWDETIPTMTKTIYAIAAYKVKGKGIAVRKPGQWIDSVTFKPGGVEYCDRIIGLDSIDCK